MQEKIVVCPSCGAHFAAEEPRCPYCGTLYVPAAEREYMEKLEDVREELEDVGDAGRKAHRSEAKKTWKLVLWAVVIVAVIAGITIGLRALGISREKAEARAEYRWQREHFPELDKAYEAGEYDRMLSLYDEGLEGDHDMWQWSHYAFCEMYGSFRYGGETLEFVKKEPSEEEKYREDLLWCYLEMRGVAFRDRMPASDREKAASMTAELQQEIAEHLGLTEADIAAFDSQLKAHSGYPDFDEIRAFFR